MGKRSRRSASSPGAQGAGRGGLGRPDGGESCGSGRARPELGKTRSIRSLWCSSGRMAKRRWRGSRRGPGGGLGFVRGGRRRRCYASATATLFDCAPYLSRARLDRFTPFVACMIPRVPDHARAPPRWWRLPPLAISRPDSMPNVVRWSVGAELDTMAGGRAPRSCIVHGIAS